MPSSRETTAPARAPKSNRRALPRCMHGCSSEMTSTDLVCAPTSSSPATRLVPSLPAAAQPSPRLAARAAAGGDLAVDAELDMPTPCCLRCCQWRSCGCLCRCRWRPCLAALHAAGGGLAAAAGALLLFLVNIHVFLVKETVQRCGQIQVHHQRI